MRIDYLNVHTDVGAPPEIYTLSAYYRNETSKIGFHVV